MALNSAVTRKLDNSYVQVEIGSGKRGPKYYKVPENKADEFQKEYIKSSNKMQWTSTGVMIGAIFTMIIPTYFATASMKNKTLKMALGLTAGLIGGICSMFISDNIEKKSHAKLLKKFDAKEMDYSKSRLPI